MASVTACLVMALNTTRSILWSLIARFSFSTSSTCQEIASPSRPGAGAGGALQGLGGGVGSAGGLGVDLPDHLEIGFRIDRSVLGRQVADMTERGQNLAGGAQIFFDLLGL